MYLIKKMRETEIANKAEAFKNAINGLVEIDSEVEEANK